ncbi:MAG TPA: hypothetical protein VHV29_00585 [Terriglobales bacterium]|jgi:hypothetical protein|nr:hypothetical protein [Terriglobales bacterium]
MKLFDKSLAMVAALIKLSAFPLLRPVRRLAIGLLEIAYGDAEEAVESEVKNKTRPRIHHS